MLNASDVIAQARRTIDRIPISGELTARPQDVAESPSRTIADAAFLGWIAAEEREIVGSCKAAHVPGALWTGDPEDPPAPVVRVLPGRVRRQSAAGAWRPARPRSLAEHRDLESSGRPATPGRPAYVHETGDVMVYPSGGAVEATVVLSPRRIAAESYSDGDDELTLDERFSAALVYGTCAQAERMLSEETPSRMQFSEQYRELAGYFQRPFLRTHRFGRYEQFERGKIDNREGAVE